MNGRVLIVDDETVLREVMAKAFRTEGYKVFEAADGKEALEVFEENDIEIIILDVMMP